MIAQIIYAFVMLVGAGVIAGKISNGTYCKEFSAKYSLLGLIFIFGLFWWGGLFDQPLNIWGWLLVGIHLYGLGRNISKSGETKIVTGATLSFLISFSIEIGLSIGSGFLDPLIK